RGALALLAVRGSFAGPMAAGTAFQYLFHAPSSGLVGNRDTRFVKGGIGALASALAKALQSFRGEVRTGCRVARILVDKGRATGVALDSGEELRSGLVVSSADPRVTYFQLLDPAELPLKVVRRVKNIRFRGSTAKLNLALSGLPHFEGVEGLEPLMGQIILCPAVEYLERAYDHAKYGRMSGSPALEVLIPSLLEPALAPPGGHVMSIVVRYTPYHLREGGWDQLAEVLADRVLDQLAAYAPDIKEKIVGRQILTPLDLERRLALSEGSIYHGQMGLDQLLFMRPIPGFGRYRTPIEGLYLCGAGTHPGGGVSGAPGYNAARVIHQNWMG
ncbi:MAG: NAD(P)/FAD-dependent oxidoreductase, partial [Anaerolineales bacterium]|nr:NAD(P)/FAD-dependent oxidoreductase [Anaerolineales bacterium]